MKKNNTITNTKGAEYYMTTYNSNLDVFTMLSRYNSDEEIIRLFNNALNEKVKRYNSRNYTENYQL